MDHAQNNAPTTIKLSIHLEFGEHHDERRFRLLGIFLINRRDPKKEAVIFDGGGRFHMMDDKEVKEVDNVAEETIEGWYIRCLFYIH
jgi:hypothetical protein